jgi:hypothetical protein
MLLVRECRSANIYSPIFSDIVFFLTFSLSLFLCAAAAENVDITLCLSDIGKANNKSMADGYMEGWRGWRLMGANKFYDDSSVVY